MDTTTLIAVDAVLATRSIRGAARLLGRPASTIAAAVARLEADISVPLVERAGSSLALTLEAVRLEADIGAAARLARQLATDQSIKLEALERFVEVIEQGSIRKAARVLGMGQPQLTRQISLIEAGFSQPLLARRSAGSTVTPHGTEMATTARLLLAAWRRLSRAADERFRKTAATARLGSVIPLGHESEIARLLANLVARWLTERPRSPLFVSSTTAEDLLAGLKSGRFDAVFLDTEHLPPDLEGEVLARTPLAVVGARSSMGIADALLTRPLAVPSPRSGLRQRINRILDDHLSEVERSALRLVEIDSIPVILNLLLHHDFVSVLPLASVARIRNDLHQIALPDRYDMNFWLCWPQGLATTGRAILETLDESRATEGRVASPPR